MLTEVWRLPKINLIFFIAIILFASTSISYWLFDYSWLEQQRITQLTLVFIATLLYFVSNFKQPPLQFQIPPILVIALVLGLLSSFLALYPIWALKEWAKYASSMALIFYSVVFFRNEKFQYGFLFILFVVVGILTIQFVGFYTASYFTGTKSVNPYLMYPGFDNPRFYGQFQVIFIPILHALLLHDKANRRLFNKTALSVVLLIQWCLVWGLAGRGVMLGLFVALIGLLLFTRLKYKKFIAQYLFFAISGLFLYFLLFYVLPEWAKLSQNLPSGLRGGLSRREVLWLGALEMIQSHPIWGVGPLHFSAKWNHIGAHPHQAFLQFAAEWGLVATGIFIYLITRAMLKGSTVIRQTYSVLDAGVWMALVCSLVLAQVDGVFVMPYTEGWLALIAGLPFSRWQDQTDLSKANRGLFHYIFITLLMFAMAVILYILIIDVPVLHETSKTFYEEQKIGSPPRFWDQGWIPMEHKG